jgi:hypothetical protein
MMTRVMQLKAQLWELVTDKAGLARIEEATNELVRTVERVAREHYIQDIEKRLKVAKAIDTLLSKGE